MTTILFIGQCFGVLAEVLSLALVAIRVVESLYQLSQTPNLNTWGKCVQVVKNFFTIETYKEKA